MTDPSDLSVTEAELHGARHLRHKLLQDPYRPAYHFTRTILQKAVR
jgi:hypothetical protein